MSEGRIEEMVPELERHVARYPGSIEYRGLLMQAYFELAMEARSDDRMREYTDYLQKTYEQGFAILQIEPENAGVHSMMGVVAAYQGDVRRALTSFDNCRRLEPRNPGHYLNIAETLVYLGRVGRARHYLNRARRLGGHPVQAEMIELLAAWRHDDYMEVAELFDIAYHLNQDYVESWGEPEEPIESFEDFKLQCCTLPYCGPYMGKRCPPGVLKEALPTIDPETKRRELVLEMMRRRELEKIYRNRQDLEIVVEEAEEIEEPEEEGESP